MSNENEQESSSGTDKNSMKNILLVALSVCFVCAIVVSLSAVVLKPQRLANKELDRNKNILIAAGLYVEGVNAESEIKALFEKFTVRVVDLESGRFLTDYEIESAGIDTKKYDQRKAAKKATFSRALTQKEDVAQIRRRARYSVVYLLMDNNSVDRIVLPVHGYGLWSTLYGFLAVQGDGNTVSGITFYEHAETAGLGGEVDNPKWKSLWPGKRLYAVDGHVALQVIKGKVDSSTSGAEHKVDGLSGASLTSRGVQNLVAFWMGKNGFGPLLKELGKG